MPLQLRPTHPDDWPFVLHLLQTTMRGYVEAVWGRWDEAVNSEAAMKMCSTGQGSIIRRDGSDIGLIVVERAATHYQLEQLFLLPAHQRQGLGTQLVTALVAEAQARNLPVRLRVLTSNPARALYERLGFAVIESTPQRHTMEHRPRPL